MKKMFLLPALLLTFGAAYAGKYEYTTVEGDPMNTQMYTLPNGLKIFMTVNKEEPRIQANIAVRVGGKNDPAETTGLAHYFEHLMFKGTEQFGTSDYAKEKPYLDRIEQLFEKYRFTTDSTERRAIYREIDSISYEASKIAIPNEYDKLMNVIGSDGTNAYTSYDVTCYVENIPSNQIDNWARIQADRFEHPVIRGFHTELETIYEEKNMSLTKDSRKVYEKYLSALYPSHPYGTQTVLGTQENLKNPSITNVKNYHKQWYVPNNMAVCLSGDFNPDEMVDIISKYFGHLKPNDNLPRPQLPNEKPLEEPIKIEVLGPEAEQLTLAWRLPEAANEDMIVMDVLENVMNNGSSGILDVNVALPQKMLGASAGVMSMADAGVYIMAGRPKTGQTLEDVEALFKEQIEQLRKGEFSDELVEAVKENLKLYIQQMLTDNGSRARLYTNAFVNGIDWKDQIANLKKLNSITKDDVVRVANKYLNTNNYAAIYKLQGEDPAELKLAKPELTPIEMNRDKASDFLVEMQNTKVTPIEPVFINFDTDLSKYTLKGNTELLYVPNTTNDEFEVIYVYDLGSYHNPLLGYASGLLNFVGTPDMTPEQVKNEFYKLACSMRFSISPERTYAVISGLGENMEKAVELFENVMANASISQEAYDNFVARQEKARKDAKLNQSSNFSALSSYVTFGPKNPQTDALSIDSLRASSPEMFINALRDLNNYEQTVIFWGKAPAAEVSALVEKTHPIAAAPLTAPTEEVYKVVHPDETVFFIAPYEAKQLYMIGMSDRGDVYSTNLEPARTIYNEYFGGSMNAIVFQEMREARSLAYSAWAGMVAPSKAGRDYRYMSQIATQNDKLIDALAAFNDIINDMPKSESALQLAKTALESRLRTNRSTHDDIAFQYLSARGRGLDHDLNKDIFEALDKADMDMLEKYQHEQVAGRTYRYGILAKPENIDMEALQKLGKVVILTQEDIFGY